MSLVKLYCFYMFYDLVLFVTSLGQSVLKFEYHFFKFFFLSEFVRRYRWVSPLLIAFIVVGGWYEVACMYSCLLVGFMCVRMSRICFSWNIFPL